MNKVIGVTDLQRHFRSVLDEVVKHKVAYVLTRDSRPEAVMVPYEDFLTFQRLNEAQVLARFDLLVERMTRLNESVPDDEVAADLETATQASRT